MKDFNLGTSYKNNCTSKHANFNNTQKLILGNHLDCMAVLEEKDQNKQVADNNYNNQNSIYQQNMHTNHSKLNCTMGKNKENSNKYSYLGSHGFNRGLDHILAEYKKMSNKTPSHNSKVLKKCSFKPEKIKPPGEESNPYYKTQPRNQNHGEATEKNTVWKNMTHKDIFSKDILKMSGVSPLSTKNCNSKFLNFSLGREEKFDAQILELPDGLKDIEDSDLEVEDYEEPNNDNTFEDLSIEENNPK